MLFRSCWIVTQRKDWAPKTTQMIFSNISFLGGLIFRRLLIGSLRHRICPRKMICRIWASIQTFWNKCWNRMRNCRCRLGSWLINNKKSSDPLDNCSTRARQSNRTLKITPWLHQRAQQITHQPPLQTLVQILIPKLRQKKLKRRFESNK